jgi:hypothetical protein
VPRIPQFIAAYGALSHGACIAAMACLELRHRSEKRIATRHPNPRNARLNLEQPMKTATPSAITRLMTHPKTLALLLSILATSAWLGAVVSSFDAVAQAQLPQIQLPSVTVVAKAAPLLANVSASSLGSAAAAAGSKL